MAARPHLSVLAMTAAITLAAASPVSAQERGIDLSQLDPSALLAGAGDVLMRASDQAIDGLFQATHRASRTPRDAAVLCQLFDPNADRSFTALADASSRLGEDSRQAFVAALADIASSGLQGARQPYDADVARQALRSAAVTAMLLHDGFGADISADGADPASREVRCRAFGWVLDALQGMPLAQRAAATRFMLGEGLAQLGPR